MEKDVDLIIPIEEGEANVLIKLIETLFDDWYVSVRNASGALLNLWQ
ncbi:hypothetical protein NB311A_17696 [Nitrobacter sp. Nb-311A]|nr:hypothetical protein NB311A_17696 [Nitrobacter sp. Nb-311A]